MPLACTRKNKLLNLRFPSLSDIPLSHFHIFTFFHCWLSHFYTFTPSTSFTVYCRLLTLSSLPCFSPSILAFTYYCIFTFITVYHRFVTPHVIAFSYLPVFIFLHRRISAPLVANSSPLTVWCLGYLAPSTVGAFLTVRSHLPLYSRIFSHRLFLPSPALSVLSHRLFSPSPAPSDLFSTSVLTFYCSVASVALLTVPSPGILVLTFQDNIADAPRPFYDRASHCVPSPSQYAVYPCMYPARSLPYQCEYFSWIVTDFRRRLG